MSNDILFNAVKEKVGLVAHSHTLQSGITDMHSHGTAVTSLNKDAFKALCDLVEDEFVKVAEVIVLQNDVIESLKKRIETMGFLTESDMNIK